MHEDQPKRRQKIAFESQPAERVGIDQHFTVGAGATKNFYEPVAITTPKASHIHKKRKEGSSPGMIASETRSNGFTKKHNEGNKPFRLF